MAKTYFFTCRNANATYKATGYNLQAKGESLADAIANLPAGFTPYEALVENGNQLTRFSPSQLLAACS
jgi:hypothetical protein